MRFEKKALRTWGRLKKAYCVMGGLRNWFRGSFGKWVKMESEGKVKNQCDSSLLSFWGWKGDASQQSIRRYSPSIFTVIKQVKLLFTCLCVFYIYIYLSTMHGLTVASCLQSMWCLLGLQVYIRVRVR